MERFSNYLKWRRLRTISGQFSGQFVRSWTQNQGVGRPAGGGLVVTEWAKWGVGWCLEVGWSPREYGSIVFQNGKKMSRHFSMQNIQ